MDYATLTADQFATLTADQWAALPIDAPVDLAVYPDPADVLLGVTYGPNGNDYTGTATGGAVDYQAIATATVTALNASPEQQALQAGVSGIVDQTVTVKAVTEGGGGEPVTVEMNSYSAK